MKAIAKYFIRAVVVIALLVNKHYLKAQCVSNEIVTVVGSASTNPVADVGQTFLTPSGGIRKLEGITLRSGSSGRTLGFDITIYEGKGWSGTQLFTDNILQTSIPDFAEIYFPLNNGPFLDPESDYTFRVQVANEQLSVITGNVYPDGDFVFENELYAIQDFYFRIHTSDVLVPTITESSNTLTSSAASSYQWIKDGIDINGATSQTLDVSNQEGSYQVRITDSNGCEGISESFTVDNKVPVFTSANTTTVQEGTTGTIYSASSTDLSQPITYSLANGVNDNNLFNINGADISFIMPPVFNQGGNNTYTFTATATDAATNSSTLDVTVTVFRPLSPPNGDCGSVLNFDGSNEHIEFGNFSTELDNGSALTISYYFKGTHLQSPVRIQGGSDYLVTGWTANTISNTPKHILSWDGATSGIDVGNVTNIYDAQWHHVAVTWEQGVTNGFRSYLDGNLIQSRNAGNASIPVLSNDVFNIGSFQGFGEFITGALDEVSIWDRALTQSEIQDMGSNGINGNEPNLLHYYNFNETTGTALTDLTGSLNGTLTNMESLDWTDINGNAITSGSQSIINFSDITKTLGDADFDLTAESDAGTEAQGFTITYQSSDPSVAAVSGKTVSIVSAGTTTITATQAGGVIGGACYNLVSKAQTLTVKAPLTITANDVTIDYGDDLAGLLSVTYSGFINGDDASDLTGTLSFADITDTEASGAPYLDVIIPSGLSSDNYTITYESGDLTISPASLTVTANDLTIDYGDDPTSSLAVNYLGFVNGDGETDLTGTLVFVSLPMNASATPYTDAIIPSGLSSSNYTISYASGDLTINPVALTITADDLTVDYGDNPSGSLSVSYTGFVNGEDATDLTGALSFASITDTDASATPYSDVIIPSGLTSNNYSVNYVNGDLTINPVALTITANNLTIDYGDDPSSLLSVTYSGFVNGEDASNLTGTLSFASITDTDVSTNPYTQVIIPSGLSSDNYDISYASADLIINKAALTISANDLTIVFGEDPTSSLSVTYTGLVNGEDETDLAGMLSFASILATDASTTPYADVIIPSGLSSNNYSITYQNADLSINKAPQVIIFEILEEFNLVTTNEIILTATGGASGEPVIFATSDESVVEINQDDREANFLNAGMVTITATQEGNENYEAATPVAQNLTIIELHIWGGTNWNSGTRAPTNKDLLIEADYTTSSHGTFEAANLEIAENITLTIDDQDAIVVNDDLIMDGDITLNSGGILALFGNTSGTGTVTTNRSVTPDLGYSMVGTTVGNVSVSVLSVSPDFLYGFDGTNFNIPTTLEPGKGYFVAYDSPTPLFTVEGTPTTGTVSVSLMYADDGDATNDFNLLSNPYNAAISRQSFVDNNTFIDGVTYYWQDGGTNLPSGSRSGNYVTVTADGTTTGGTFDGNIRSGQGFFVRATSSSTISFDPEDQVTDLTSNTDGGFFRTAFTQMIRLTITNQTSKDEAVITFSENGTPSLDQGLDAYKFMNPGLSLYSLAGETALAIQALPEITEAVQIPLGYQTTATGEAQFSVDLSAFSSSEDIYLHDQLTGNKIDLRANPSPTFTLDNTQSQTRFVLKVSGRLLSASQNLDPSLLVYGSKESLTVKAADLSGDHLVQIHSLEGKLLYNQRVIFESGQAQLSPQIRMSGLYLLQVGGKQTKFITRD